jgi:hypothetical protein
MTPNDDKPLPTIQCGICNKTCYEYESRNALFVGRICPLCESSFVRTKHKWMKKDAKLSKSLSKYMRELKSGKREPDFTMQVKLADGTEYTSMVVFT